MKAAVTVLAVLSLVVVASGCEDWDDSYEWYQPLPAAEKYQGESLSKWTELLDSKDPALRLKAVKAMEAYGPNAAHAVPRLLEMFDDAAPIPETVFAALYRVGSEGAVAVPKLVAVAQDNEDLRPLAVKALGAMGPHAREAVPMLVGFLDRYQAKRDYDSLYRVVTALGQIGPDASEAAPRLCRALENSGGPPYLRIGAAEALGLVRSHPEMSVLCLASAATRDERCAVRGRALEALGEFGAWAAPALPAIEKAREDDQDLMVRRSASYAGARVVGSKQIEEWIDLLDSQEAWEKRSAFAVLRFWRKRPFWDRYSAAALAKLLPLTDEGDPWQVEAIRTLAAIGPYAKDATPHLMRALSSSHAEARAAAVQALVEIGVSSPEVVAALERATSDTDPVVSKAAKQAMEAVTHGQRRQEQ